VVNTITPDFVAIHRMIDDAIEKSERNVPAAPRSTDDPETTKPNLTQSSANSTDDLAASC
jgi:hypothetical protein